MVMDNKLTKIETDELVSIIDNYGVTDLIKPLIKEIYLFDTFVSGTSTLDNVSSIRKLVPGQPLVLRREESKFDKNAIAIFTQGNEKIGYIPRKDNSIFSRLLDAGKLLTAKIKEINPRGDFAIIKIDIFLVDF